MIYQYNHYLPQCVMCSWLLTRNNKLRIRTIFSWQWPINTQIVKTPMKIPIANANIPAIERSETINTRERCQTLESYLSCMHESYIVSSWWINQWCWCKRYGILWGWFFRLRGSEVIRLRCHCCKGRYGSCWLHLIPHIGVFTSYIIVYQVSSGGVVCLI